MRLLLDTNIVIMVAHDDGRLSASHETLLAQPETQAFVSAIALWEIAIKYRSGKLALSMLPETLVGHLPDWRIELLELGATHAVADADLPVELKDPFDRMFVAIAERERMRFMTTDAKLLDHPLAWRP